MFYAKEGVKKILEGTSLVVQRIRIHMPMQGKWVQPLGWEDSSCCRATKPECHNHWARDLGPTGCSYWAHVLQPLKPKRLEPVLHSKRSRRNEKPMHCNKERPQLATTREILQAATEAHSSQKWINKYINTQIKNTVKMYCWSFQLKENWFWWSSQLGLGKKAVSRSMVTYQVPCWVAPVKILDLGRLLQ